MSTPSSPSAALLHSESGVPTEEDSKLLELPIPAAQAMLAEPNWTVSHGR